MANDLKVGVVETVFAESAALEAFDELVHVCAAEIEYGADVEGIMEHFGLVDVTGDAVEDKGVLVRIEAAAALAVFDELAPKVHGGFVGDEFATAGVFDENAAERAVGGEVAKDVAAGAMEEVGNGAKNLALGSLARAGGAKQQDGTKFHKSAESILDTSSFDFNRPWSGACKRRHYRNLGVFMLQLNFLNFNERDDDFLGGMAGLNLQVDFVGGDAADALGDIGSAGGFDGQIHFLVRLGARHGEVAGQLGLEETAVESELASREGLGRRQNGTGGHGSSLGGGFGGLGSCLVGNDGSLDGFFEDGLMVFLHLFPQFGGHGEEDDRANKRSDCGDATDEPDGLSAENGNLIGGIKIATVNNEHHEDADAGCEEGSNEGAGDRPFQAGHRLDFDIGALRFFLLINLDEWLDELGDFGIALKLLEVVLGKFSPRYAVAEGTVGLLEDKALIIRGNQFASHGLAAGEVEGLGKSGSREQAAKRQKDTESIKLMHDGFLHNKWGKAKEENSPLNAGKLRLLGGLSVESEVLGSGAVANFLRQILQDPVFSGGDEAVGSGTVLPDSVADGFEGVGLKSFLGQGTGEVAGQYVATAALSEERVAGGIDDERAGASANKSLATFQDDPAVSQASRKFAESVGAIFLHTLGGGAQKPRGLAGVWGDDADGVVGNGHADGQPIESAGIDDDGDRGIVPNTAGGRFQHLGQIRRGEAGADQDGVEITGQFEIGLPMMNHDRLQLGSDGLVNRFRRVKGDQAGLGPLRAARGEDSRAVVTETSRDDREAAEVAFVGESGTGRGPAFKILRQGPMQFASEGAMSQSDVMGDFEASDVRPGRRQKHAVLGRTEGESDGGYDGRAFGFAGIGIQPRGDIHGEDLGLEIVDVLDQFGPFFVERPVEADAEQAIHDQGGTFSEHLENFGELMVEIGDVAQLDGEILEVVNGVAGVIAVVAFAGEDEDQFSRADHLAGAVGDDFADAGDDLGFGDAGGPGCVFPFAHLRHCDDWCWHGRRLHWIGGGNKKKGSGEF
ncbi:MAG: hypothetical protein JWR26_3349 [Pedosphaera sp.]|nr:hypothetical protein [Pedosphaera sp.]